MFFKGRELFVCFILFWFYCWSVLWYRVHTHCFFSLMFLKAMNELVFFVCFLFHQCPIIKEQENRELWACGWVSETAFIFLTISPPASGLKWFPSCSKRKENISCIPFQWSCFQCCTVAPVTNCYQRSFRALPPAQLSAQSQHPILSHPWILQCQLLLTATLTWSCSQWEILFLLNVLTVYTIWLRYASYLMLFILICAPQTQERTWNKTGDAFLMTQRFAEVSFVVWLCEYMWW